MKIDAIIAISLAILEKIVRTLIIKLPNVLNTRNQDQPNLQENIIRIH